MYRIAFLPIDNNKYITCSSEAEIALWDLSKAKILKRFKTYNSRSSRDVLVTSSGHMVGTCGNLMHIWNIWTGCLLSVVNSEDNSSEIQKVVEIPQKNKAMLLLLSGEEFGNLTLTQIAISGKDTIFTKILNKLKLSAVYDICLLSDNRVGVANRNNIEIYSIQSDPYWHFCKIRTLEGHNSSIMQILYFEKEQRLMSGSYVEQSRLWDLHSGKCLSNYSSTTGFRNHAILRLEDDIVVSGSLAGAVSLLDLKKKVRIEELEFPSYVRCNVVYDIKRCGQGCFVCVGGHMRIRFLASSKRFTENHQEL